jgi:hypothetical protein
LPFLKIIDAAVAVFHSDGNMPVLIDLPNISVSDGEIILAALFISLLGMLSKPGAFRSLILLKSI